MVSKLAPRDTPSSPSVNGPGIVPNPIHVTHEGHVAVPGVASREKRARSSQAFGSLDEESHRAEAHMVKVRRLSWLFCMTLFVCCLTRISSPFLLSPALRAAPGVAGLGAVPCRTAICISVPQANLAGVGGVGSTVVGNSQGFRLTDAVYAGH